MAYEKNISPFRYHPEDHFRVLRGSSDTLRLADEERVLLDAVHRSVVATPLLLLGQLADLGIRTSDQNLRRDLNHLFRKGFLNKMVMEDSDSGTPSQTIYALSKAYLRSRAEVPGKLDMLLCKKLLAAQQYLIMAGHFRNGSAVTVNALIAQKDIKPGFYSDRQFRCDALIQGQDGQTAFVLTVRREKNWLQKLKELLAAMERTVYSPCTLTVQTKDSNVILVCEDESHQAELETELLQDESCRYEFPISVTNDIETFSGTSRKAKPIPDLKKGLAQQVSDRLTNCIESAFKG